MRNSAFDISESTIYEERRKKVIVAVSFIIRAFYEQVMIQCI